jgi:hypothetical protein
MTTIHRIGTGVALAITLATSAAPASARVLDLNANGSYVPAGPVNAQALNPSRGGSAPVQTQAPSASPALIQGLRLKAEAAALGHRGGAVASTTGSPTARSNTTAHSPRVTALSSGGPFGWGDAGIGAAGMLLLVSVGAGVAVTTRRQRRRVTAS